MQKIQIVINEDLLNKIKEASQKNKQSLSAFIREAVKHYLTCQKKTEIPTLHQIITKYKGKCFKCGREIQTGEIAFWGRDVGLMCSDCIINAQSDKAMALKYMKIRELQKTLQSLKKMCNEYSDRLIKMKKEYDLYIILEKFHNLARKMETYPYQREFLTEFKELLQEAEKLKEIEASFHITVKPKKGRWIGG